MNLQVNVPQGMLGLLLIAFQIVTQEWALTERLSWPRLNQGIA